MRPVKPGVLVALTLIVTLLLCAILLPVQWRATHPKGAVRPGKTAFQRWTGQTLEKVHQVFLKCQRTAIMAYRWARYRVERVFRGLQVRKDWAHRRRPLPTALP